MRLPFKVEKSYTTSLAYYDIYNELENLKPIKLVGGLRVDKINYDITANIFKIQRYSNGITAFFEYYPLIKGDIVSQNPTRINLKFIPNYFAIIFFSIFVLGFFIGGVFVDNWTINGVHRTPTLNERILIVFLGCGIPILWCYLQWIRPIKKAEKWIVEKLKLSEESNGS